MSSRTLSALALVVAPLMGTGALVTLGGGCSEDEAINQCWETHCRATCVEQQPDAGGITDGAAPDGGTCNLPVITVSLSCDECTHTSCCAAWDTCFQDPQCAELNTCYQHCTD